MKKIKYISTIWIMILSILLQSSTAFATNVQDLKNTAPVANFTVEKSRDVRLIILTDYAGADNANLKNSITSMKSELANYVKINIEYANLTDIVIGTQQGFFTENYWYKHATATYTWSGNDEISRFGSEVDYKETYGKEERERFTYSPCVALPDGQTPTMVYNPPTSYNKSSLKETTYANGYRKYYEYSFINNMGICPGSFKFTEESYTYGGASYIKYYHKLNSEPVFTFEDYWDIANSEEVTVTNNVVGYDLSKLNYEVKDNTDTFVIFALNNESTDYYTSYISNSYRLGQLRSDSNLANFVKDSDARVYSICSDNLENVNLSSNPKYPVTFNGADQNITLKDLVDSSFDGRSIGQKNITGLVNKIKENVKRPSDKIDMIVATDKNISNTDSFVNSIKDNISPDVTINTNVINMDSLDNIDTWTKYVTKGDYRNIDTGNSKDIHLILAGNGDLWAQGSNQCKFSPTYNSNQYGLFGLSKTVTYYPQFVKILTDVQDVVLYDYTSYRSLTVLKKDGTIWNCEQYKEGWKRDNYYPSIKTMYKGGYDGTSFFITNDNRIIIGSRIDNYAPPDVQYAYTDKMTYGYTIFYLTNDGSIYKRDVYTDGRSNSEPPAEFLTKLPAPVKDMCNITGLIYCTNNMIYTCDGYNLHGLKIKKAYLHQSENYLIGEDGNIYTYDGDYTVARISNRGFKEILHVEENYNRGIIGIDLNGELAYSGDVLYSSLLDTNNYKNAGKTNPHYGDVPKPFDASVNGYAANYLKIGSHFAYVTKKGEICYVDDVHTYTDSWGEAHYEFQTVNMGKADSIFDTSPIPVKAFSQSKILNTPLSAGSERYFIYISDNIEKDTYFKDPSDYFLFGNLDSTILNYLNANRFNIYVVTPAQARDLKLQYPYSPVNQQQYSLKELIYNSVMDSAFCKDEETVRKLIIKKYDTFTKQGSTTLTLLVNEESVRYNQVYRDFENDPKHSEKWQYTHDSTYFDNSTGLDTQSGKWITEPLYTFSKVGKYIVSAQFRDNPKNDNRFDNYRLWSNTSAPATILVHRRPIALFNVQVSSKVGTSINLSYLDQSYDLDHNISRTDKGIVARVWQYKKSTSDTWIEGKPSSLTHNSGIYQIRLKVKDMEGVWSKPYIDTINTTNLPPSIDATPKTYNGHGAVNISISATDHGENDYNYMRYAVTTSTIPPNSSQWIQVSNGIKTKGITIDTEGTFYLHMEAYDTAGLVGKNITGPYIVILNRPPQVSISKSLSYIYEGDNLEIYMKPTDPDNDPLDMVLEEKKDSGAWKTVFTKTACASGSTQTYSITKIPAGNYQYRVTVTDPSGETASESLSFTAYPLGINGIVDHTPIWKSNWVNYNKHLTSIGKSTFGNDTFFTGEKYILSATTTKISPESNITALNISVKIIERTYSPVLLTKQSLNAFTGEMWNEDMRGTRWRGKQATFLFTVTYSNGTVKTDSVITNIIDDDYFRVKMSF